MTDDTDWTRIHELRKRAQERVGDMANVISVGYGLKQVGGDLTDEPALVVVVREKEAAGELEPSDLVPEEIDGVPTDVRVIPRGRRFGTGDTKRHSPLIGGINVTNLKAGPHGIGVGTLGCFATIDGASGPDNVVLLSNRHVLVDHGGNTGEVIYQPSLTGGAIDLSNKNPIGKVHHEGMEGKRKYTYPTEPDEIEYHIDCATAKIDIDISSWCDCNCGQSYKNELRELNIGGNSKLEGVGRAAVGDAYKSGGKSGATQGRITHLLVPAELEGKEPGDPARTVENVMWIDTSTSPDPFFSDEGDSGAALVNDQNELVGLVFGGQDITLANPLSFACHIAPVLDLLEVTPISTQNPPVGPAGHARSSRLARVGSSATSVEDHTVELQERLRRTPTGAALHAAFLEHRSEVVGLVNRHRPTTIAWHRGKGPTFFAHIAENARHPEHRIPVEVEGVTRGELLERMEEALTTHGSEPLRRAIAEHREAVLAMVDDVDDLHELVGRFEESAAHV